MALKDTTSHMKDLLGKITEDLHKAERGNKAASQRVRTATVRLEKIAKSFRKESIASEKNTKSKKPAKKAAAKAKPQVKKAAKPAKKAIARPRALSFRKPSAKLPARRTFR